ncbi:tyrosine-type recombinase/integrase [Oscillospiraceae bacterium 44-5]
MSSIKKMTTKAGKEFCLIRASRGRGAAPLSTRWYPQEGWSARYTDRELKKYAAEFERKVQAGEVISRSEQKERELEAKRAATKIMTVRQYIDTVFMPAKVVTISENSRYTYQGNIDRYIYPALGDLKLPDVTQANITALLQSGKTRTIDVDPDVLALLRQLRRKQASEAISRYVFAEDGSPDPMLPNELNWYMDKFSKRYNIPGLHPHKFRHTYASISITSGADIASVSENLGHSNKAVTLNMYTHSDAERRKQANQVYREELKKAGQG